MNSAEIRNRFLLFFEKRGHAVIKSASLITSDEKGVTNSTLFNSAGMQPLIPYLLGKPHPKGVRLVDVQKCLRTVDIDGIGDKTHATFFEMLGNWSLGDYFKKEAINWSYEFLTSNSDVEGDRGLELNPKQLYVTVFEGDSNSPKDEEAADIWKEIFAKNSISGERIFYLPAENNWWQAGESGPCGPDTEMYYDVKNIFGGRGLTHEEFLKADKERIVVEVWNNVFMQYEKKDGKIVGKLSKPSIDTGAGLERLAMTLQNVDNIYDTDLLSPIMKITSTLSNDIKSARIIADHLRSSVFLLAEGVIPSNTDRGYVLRKLIRRAVFKTDKKFIEETELESLFNSICLIYENIYTEIKSRKNIIIDELRKEILKFNDTLGIGLKEFHRMQNSSNNITGEGAFTLFSSWGIPMEMILEEAKEIGKPINKEEIRNFEEKLKKHLELSRAGAEKKFKGGLAETDEMSVKYHTATHLLHQALHDVLGEDNAQQKGSNITAKRLRFDFSYPSKLTGEQKKAVEDMINGKIKANLKVNKIILNREEAEKTRARHFFSEKYGDSVSVYYIGDSLESAYSKEFCGGPHVENTGILGHFKIIKEEAVSAGVRRIKAILE